MIGGFVKLCSLKDDKVLQITYYKSIAHRYKIIKEWKKLYARNFNKGYLQIEPLVNDLLVKENGRNGTDSGYVKRLPKKVEVKFERPKAEYSNNPSPYGISDELHKQKIRTL